MRITVVKAVSAVLLAAPIVGPATVLLTQSYAASPASAACPAGSSTHPGGTYTQDKQNLTPVRITGTNACYNGISVKGNFSPSSTWWQLKQCCNGAAISIDGGAVTLANTRLQNASTDGIRIWNKAATTITGAWTQDTRDDCISDITHGNLYIRNSLFDGCHTGISWRSDSNNNKTPFTVDVQNSMFYIKPMTDNGSGGNCKEWVVGGKDNGTMFKMDSVQSGVNLQNVIIRMDLANYQCVDTWPSGTYKNVLLVWNNPNPYPGKLPPGVVMTRNVRIWDALKSWFVARHSNVTLPAPPPVTVPAPQPPIDNPPPAPNPGPTTNPSPAPSPTGKPVPGQQGGPGGSAPSSCPSNQTAMRSGASYNGSSSNTTYNGSGATFTETENNLTPVVLNGNNNCLINATINSSIDRGIKWWQMKQCCNGAGLTLNGSAYLQNVRIDNAGVDGIRIWNSAGVTMNGVYTTYTRDDCISDITHGDLVIKDSLFDGCHTGISWRSDNNSNKSQFTINMSDTMFYVEPEPGSTSGGSCTQYVVNGNANGPMWKMDGTQTNVVNLNNVIIRQDLGNHECKDMWPTGTYHNVTFVWTGSGNYPGQLPAGVTLTRDVSVWNNAKAAWLARHGY